MSRSIYNSWQVFHKNPFGAVKQETNIHFKIVLERKLKCSAAYLIMKHDYTGNDVVSSMYWCGEDGHGYEEWECDFSPKSCGLYWYHFEIDTSQGRKKILKSSNSEGNYDLGTPWQLTVYEKNLKVPNWIKGGIMYQIFPDRFFASGQKKEAVPTDRTLRSDWGAQPEWQPNNDGVITNSDYFCGDLEGIRQKLSYLKQLNITCIYLNPVFEAHSNHRYNTANYERIDPLLGSEKDFSKLCEDAQKYGIRVILDGVFSHTGSDSVYFNREGRYETIGAYQSEKSHYSNWYHFITWPYNYHSWWGFDTLPEVNETDPSYNNYINGDGGIASKWLRLGASGWRLDVADELPDAFLENFRDAVKKEKKDALIIGEVWEDASNKESYGLRRRYLLGRQLDSVMNYPFREAILGFLKGYTGFKVRDMIMSIVENYPKDCLDVLMNHIGTHDTERSVTVLAGEPVHSRGREWQSTAHMSQKQKITGIELMKIASAMQYTLPGVPCIYYGDEAFTEGYKDPFNRTCYPWHKQEKSLLDWYIQLGNIRKDNSDFSDGIIEFTDVREKLVAYKRGKNTLCVFNASDQITTVKLPKSFEYSKVHLLISKNSNIKNQQIILYGKSCMILKK